MGLIILFPHSPLYGKTSVCVALVVSLLILILLLVLMLRLPFN